MEIREWKSGITYLQVHQALASAGQATARMQLRSDPDSDDGVGIGVGSGSERTHLQRLIAASDRETVRVEAVGAPFSKKDVLRARGFCWDANLLRKVWWREIATEDVEAEQLWFQREGLPSARLSRISRNTPERWAFRASPRHQGRSVSLSSAAHGTRCVINVWPTCLALA